MRFGLRRRRRLARLAGGVALLLFTLSAQAETDIAATMRISIIIDDMGDQREAGLRALDLPGAVTYAFLPHTPHARSLAESAHRLGKEVMLHLPMQAMESNHFLGPGALTLDMSRHQFRTTLRQDLNAVPHVAGINNHMGSLLTRHPGHMQWLMEELTQRVGLYFVDSRTTHHSVAAQLAREHNIPARQRDVFLDDDPSPDAILHQFKRLINKAVRQGSAIGIGHPYDSTLTVLSVMIPQLARAGIALVPVSTLLQDSPDTQWARPAGAPPGPLVYNTSGLSESAGDNTP